MKIILSGGPANRNYHDIMDELTEWPIVELLETPVGEPPPSEEHSALPTRTGIYRKTPHMYKDCVIFEWRGYEEGYGNSK